MVGEICFRADFWEDFGEKLQFGRIRWILNVHIDLFRIGGLADVCRCGRDKSDKFMFFKKAMRLCSCLNKLHIRCIYTTFENAGQGHVGSRKCNAAPIPCAWSRHPCSQLLSTGNIGVCLLLEYRYIHIRTIYISWDDFLACDDLCQVLHQRFVLHYVYLL